MLAIIDYLSVLIYGILIMVFFLDLSANKRNSLLITSYISISILLQIILQYYWGTSFIEKAYPLLVHLPIVIFFHLVYKKRLSLVFFALFTSYLFTAPRRWIGEVISLFFDNDVAILIGTKILVSIVFLFLIYKYLAPYVKRILNYSTSRIVLLTVIPASSYFITYATTVYTNALYNSSLLVVGLFSVGFNCLFYSFLIVYFAEMDRRFSLETEQTILKLQVDTTMLQIADYQDSQHQGAIYRHDLRHHLQFLNSCIVNRNTDEALAYISKISHDVDATQIIQYCENSSINIILSAYVTKACHKNIAIEIDANIPTIIPIHATDICVILSNSIENAIYACTKVSESKNCKIKVLCKFKNNKIIIEIHNNFEGTIYYEDGIPSTKKKNHGFGVKSIIAAVNKNQGIYSFNASNGIFVLRVIL